VAAALPGMDSTENKPPEDSILFLCKKYLNAIDTYNNFPKAQFYSWNNSILGAFYSLEICSYDLMVDFMISFYLFCLDLILSSARSGAQRHPQRVAQPRWQLFVLTGRRGAAATVTGRSAPASNTFLRDAARFCWFYSLVFTCTFN
jgi:hypothetical protein